MADRFAHESRRVRDRLEPAVARVLVRHAREPLRLREPAAATAPWFTLHDVDGAPLVLVSAHAGAVNLLLGQRGFLATRQTASTPPDHLVDWFETMLDGALGGGLVDHGDGRATLRTRQGAISLIA